MDLIDHIMNTNPKTFVRCEWEINITFRNEVAVWCPDCDVQKELVIV